ncbi:MAG: hypothetical protein HY717_15270 [Planctomycetes bacterium]|nr:hypothetical protein [Planctomycetota bacterium]
MKRRGKLVMLISGAMVLALLAILAWRWEDVYLEVYAYRTGWRFVWMPPRVTPWNKKSLNNAGQVAANLEAITEKVDLCHAGLWSLADRTFRPLGEVPGSGPWTVAKAINELGSIVGDVPCEWNDGTVLLNTEAFLWIPREGFIKIPKQTPYSVVPNDIDNADTVVGTAGGTQPFYYRKGGSLRAIKSLGSGEGFAVAINKQGWILGNSGDPIRPVLWKSTEDPLDLGLPAGFRKGYAADLNDNGEAVAIFSRSRANSTEDHPFLWTEKAGYIPLPYPDGYNFILAGTINNRGEILLSSPRGNGNNRSWDYYLVTKSGLRQLPAAPDGRPVVYTSLNDKGYVAGCVGTAWDISRSGRRGFVAIPVR